MSDIEIAVGDFWITKRHPIECEVTQIDVDDDTTWITSYSKDDDEYDAVSKHDFLRDYTFLRKGVKDGSTKPKAVQILNEAVAIMAERGKSYDKSGGEAERSMPKIVAMFNALTGHELTPEQGWKFMCCLKLARSEQGEYREDNYLDGAAYMALAGEEAEVSSEAADD